MLKIFSIAKLFILYLQPQKQEQNINGEVAQLVRAHDS